MSPGLDWHAGDCFDRDSLLPDSLFLDGARRRLGMHGDPAFRGKRRRSRPVDAILPAQAAPVLNSCDKLFALGYQVVGAKSNNHFHLALHPAARLPTSTCTA